MKLNKKYGFTIAEVLITLVIIGILALLLMTSVRTYNISNWQRSNDYKMGLIKYDKVYNAINLSFTNQSLKNAAFFDNNKLEAITKALDSLSTTCRGSNCEFTAFEKANIESLKRQLSDGMQISVQGFENKDGQSLHNELNNLAYTIYVDTNGEAQPNSLGSDILPIYIDADGNVININPQSGTTYIQKEQKKYLSKQYKLDCGKGYNGYKLMVKNALTGIYEEKENTCKKDENEKCYQYNLYDPNETICAMELFSILANEEELKSLEMKDLLYISDVGSYAGGGNSKYTISKDKMAKAFTKYSEDSKEGKFIKKFYNGTAPTKFYNDVAYIGHGWGSNSNNYLDFGEFVDGIIQPRMGVSISRRAGNRSSYEGMHKDVAITLSKLPDEDVSISAMKLFAILADNPDIEKMKLADILYISDVGSYAGGRNSVYTVSKDKMARAYNKYSADTLEGKFVRMFYDGSNPTKLFKEIAYYGHAWGPDSNNYMDFGEYVGGVGINAPRSVYDKSSYNKLQKDDVVWLSTLKNKS